LVVVVASVVTAPVVFEPPFDPPPELPLAPPLVSLPSLLDATVVPAPPVEALLPESSPHATRTSSVAAMSAAARRRKKRTYRGTRSIPKGIHDMLVVSPAGVRRSSLRVSASEWGL
jgi:hypothetical protein